MDRHGQLSLQNLTTSAITVEGHHGGRRDRRCHRHDHAGGGHRRRPQRRPSELADQFNNLRTQIDRRPQDSGYNGVNLLNGDTLNAELQRERHQLDRRSDEGRQRQRVRHQLAPTSVSPPDHRPVLPTTRQLDTLATTITAALTTLQTQATAISSSLSVVQTRQDFTKQMVNTLQTGADNLVLADPNQEGANLLALQTRQSLSTTALSMASQAQQAVLRLFQ